jgi:hypothetical protein
LLTRELEELRGVCALRGGVDACVLEKLQDVVDKACYQLGTRTLLVLCWCFAATLLVLAGTKVKTLEKLREVVDKACYQLGTRALLVLYWYFTGTLLVLCWYKSPNTGETARGC